MWCWRRMEKISWPDRVRNKEVLNSVKEDRNILHTIKRRKTNWIGHILRRNCLLKHVIEGKLEGRIKITGRRGRRRKQLLDDLKKKRRYWKLKEEAPDRTKWRSRFERGYGPVVRQTKELINLLHPHLFILRVFLFPCFCSWIAGIFRATGSCCLLTVRARLFYYTHVVTVLFYIFLAEAGGINFLRNDATYLPKYTASHDRSPRSSKCLLSRCFATLAFYISRVSYTYDTGFASLNVL
jgi:hypothetical protein